MTRRLATSLLAVLTIACATTRSAGASRIQRIDAAAAGGCEHLGTVQGSSSLSGIGKNAGMTNSVNEMFEKALERGATHVSYDDKQGTYWTTSQVVEGVAYKCPPGYSGVSQTSGCAKDLDCKGDRICVKGSCESPPKQ